MTLSQPRNSSKHAAIWALAYQPETGRLLTGSWKGRALLWTRTGDLVTKMQRHTCCVICAIPCSGGFATGGADGRVVLWNRDGEYKKEIHAHANAVWCLTTLPNGRIASGGRDNSVRVWDIYGQLHQEYMNIHSKGVTAVCSVSDGIVSADGSGQILYRNEVGRLIGTARHGSNVRCVSRTGDTTIAVGGKDGKISHWNVDPIKGFTMIREHRSGLGPACCSASINNCMYAVGGLEGNASVWGSDGQLLLTIPATYVPMRSIYFIGTWGVACGYDNGKVMVHKLGEATDDIETCSVLSVGSIGSTISSVFTLDTASCKARESRRSGYDTLSVRSISNYSNASVFEIDSDVHSVCTVEDTEHLNDIEDERVEAVVELEP